MKQKSSLRIEFCEKIEDISEEERELWERMGDTKKIGRSWEYRRIYPLLYTVDYPKEIPGNTKECLIQFTDQSQIVVKGSYDDVCNKIDDREAMEKSAEEYEEGQE
jgi:hypothetical protein